MKVNTSITIDIKTMIHLEKIKNKSKYINELITKDIKENTKWQKKT